MSERVVRGRGDARFRARKAGAFALGSVLALGATTAQAQEAAQAATLSPFGDDGSPASQDEGEYAFDGRGVYALGGAGYLPGIEEPMAGGRVLVAFSLVDWLGLELMTGGSTFTTADHHDDPVDVSFVSIGAGVRFAGPLSWAVRPYVSPRLQHMHFFPDPWGDHGHGDDGAADHSSHHRWAGALALGIDAGLTGPTSRFRVGAELEGGALTGPGIDAYGMLLATFGVGF